MDTGKKFTAGEAAEIMAQARATSAATHAKMQRWRTEQQQQRAGADFVCKTITNARVAEPEPAPVQQSMSAETASWVDWVDARIDEKCAAVIKAVDEALGKMFDVQHEQIQRALDVRDGKIQALRDEIDIKLGLKAKVARLKAEVSQARRLQPDFQSELDSLREKTEKQEKLITRLRSEQSILAYGQKQLETAQRKDHYEATLTAVQISAVGERTRQVLEELRANGIDFDDWAPSGLAS
jgi:hypothetical protein